MTTLDFLTTLRAKGVRLWIEEGRLRYHAPREVVTETIRSELASRKAEILDLIGTSTSVLVSSPIATQNSIKNAPLSFTEEGLWLLDQLQPGTNNWNMQSVLRLRGPLNVGVLEQSMDALIQRHDILRTYFRENGEGPTRIIAPKLVVKVPPIQLDPDSEMDTQVRRLCEEERNRPFDLSQIPLFRVRLLRCNETEHIWIFTKHHIIYDGLSARIFSHELFSLYKAFSAAESPRLADLPLQYADYALWLRQREKEITKRHLPYWKKKMEGLRRTELPTEKARPRVRSFAGAAQETALSPGVSQALRQLCKDEQVTTFMFLVAAFKVLLQRCSGNSDIAVGALIAGRSRSELESILGMFADIVVLRSDLPQCETFRNFLRAVRVTCLEAYEHQELGFDRIVSGVNPDRLSTVNPCFQVLFDVVNLPFDPPVIDGLSIERTSIGDPVARYEVVIRTLEVEDFINLHVTYDTDLFSQAYMVEMLEQYKCLIEQIVEDPDRNIGDYSLLTPSARRILPDASAPLDDTWYGAVHEIFSRHAHRQQEKIAVQDEQGTWTYAELDQRSNQLANYLQSREIAKGQVVAIYGRRSAGFVIALLGVLKTGAAFLILDPAHPAQRSGNFVKAARARAVITLDSDTGCLESLDQAAAYRISLEDCKRTNLLDAYPITAPAVTVGPDDLAYVAFTSGTTGEPKGVLCLHGSLSHFLPWMEKEFQLSGDDRYSMSCALSSNLLQREIFIPLGLGAQLCIPVTDLVSSPDRYASWMAREKITVAHLAPAMMGLLQEYTNKVTWPDLRRIFFAGDVLRREQIDLVRRFAPHAKIVSFYGTTEGQRAVGYFGLDPDEQPSHGVLPMGRGVKDVQLLVVNTSGHRAGVGELGEIWVRSPHLAGGYLDDQELSSARFIVNPFTNEPADRVYRTGEFGRYLVDGNVEFVSRGENQVSIRGFRVDLSEIETALKSHVNITDAAVCLRRDCADQLIAHIVPRAREKLSLRDLRASLRGKLPNHMLPSGFVILDALPITPAGKVDRQTLQTSASNFAECQETYLAPRTPTEEMLADIWSEVLGLEIVGIHDNFFDLGGHSLAATRVVSRVIKQFRVEIPLRALFESPSVARMAEVIAAYRGGLPVGSLAPAISRRDRNTAAPLSFAQQRLWFLHQLEPDSPRYNEASARHLRGALDVAVLQQTINEIAARHEVLRTVIEERSGEQVQIIGAPSTVEIPVVDLSCETEAVRGERAQMIMVEAARRPFALSRDHPWRVLLARLSADEHVLLVVHHHIATDGWSSQIFWSELASLYGAFVSGLPSPLEELPIQYQDYADWQRHLLQGEALQRQLAYWKQQLDGLAVLQLPTDHPRPAVQKFNGAKQRVLLPKELADGLKTLSRQESATLFMTLLAAFQTLLYRYNGQENFSVGCPVAGRTRPETEKLIGFFINALVLRADFAGEPSFRDVLRRVSTTALDAYDHQDVPFERLVEELQPQRDLNSHPLFQVTFRLRNFPRASESMSGLAVQRYELNIGGAKYDLALAMNDSERGLAAQIEYNTDLFEAPTIIRMLGHFQVLLEAIVRDPGARVSELPILGESEKNQLLVEWNDTQRDYPVDQCLHQLFEKQVERTPDAIGVIFEDQQLTYGELNRRANQLAHYLKKRGVGPEVLVGLCVERSLEMIVGALAILKAGGAYVPLDPKYPAARLQFMLDDAHASVLLTEEKFLSSFSDLEIQNPKPEIQNLRVICLDRDWSAVEQESGANPGNQATATNLAYVIYTSGSTARPKGVLIEHQQIVNYLYAICERYELTPGASYAMVQPLSVDSSQSAILPPLIFGGVLHIVSEERALDAHAWADYFARFEIDFLKIAPSHLAALQQSSAQPEKLLPRRWLIIGGEPARRDWVEELRSRASCAIFNHYGPTEATVGMLTYPVAPGDNSSASTTVPLGKPLPNTEAYVLDRHLQPVPLGVPGELCIGGRCLARGYLNLPEVTTERFIERSFAGLPPKRLYRSGDLVRYRADGNLEFLGRADTQVKIRGFRVEPAEIEAALCEQETVRAAVVAARQDDSNETQLVAYVVVRDGQAPSKDALKNSLKSRLPDYMVPSIFVFLDALPLTPHGKIDLRALPKPDPDEKEPRGNFVAPRNSTEETLADLWSQVLKRGNVGSRDNFFELGGHSLLAIQLVSRIHHAFKIDMPLRRLFETPTIEGLAKYIEATCLPAASSKSTPIISGAWEENFRFDIGAQDKCIHQLFAEHAERTPNAIAVVFNDLQLTYRELNNRANQLAHHLMRIGVGPEVLVALCFERSIEMIVSVIAVLKAGGAYVPLEPSYPAERLRFMLLDTRAAVLVTQEKLLSAVYDAMNSEPFDGQIQNPKSKIQNPTMVVLDRDWPKIAAEPTSNPNADVTPDNLAYVIYTSGSTGTPKGTLVTHYNVMRLFQSSEELFGFNSGDTWTLFHSYAFDFSVWEIWGALSYGGKLVIVPREMTRSPKEFADLLKRHNVTVLNQTPSAFRALMPVLTRESCGTLSSLRYVIFGGEVLLPRVLRPWFERYPEHPAKLIDGYGITETTVFVTFRSIAQADITSELGSLLGKPLKDLSLYLLDSNQSFVPPGVAGEIYIGGAGVTRGYLNRAELTEKRFVYRSFAGEPPQRLYRSGDLARYLPDGDLEFLGRIDDQVKIRGYRIEPGEIEATLAQHPAVRDCVVVAHEQQTDDSDNPKPEIENPKSDKRLVAYVVTHDRRPINDVRQFVQRKLPDYMVPSAFVFLDALPLTTNGKLDRSALPMPQQFRVDVDGDFTAPRNATEEILANIFAEALEIDRVSIHDNFFDLGGHSLLATQVVSRICSAFNTDLALRTFFEKPTIVALADSVQPSSSPVEALLPISHGDNIPLSFAQERLWFLDQFNPQSATYNVPNAVRLTGDLDISALEQSFSKMIRRHQALRTVFPSIRGRPSQTILPSLTLTLSTISLDEYAEAEREAVLTGQLEEEARRPFDLVRGPLIRTHLWRLAAHDHVLLLNLHHIVCDGWSMSVLWRELSALYRGYCARKPTCLPELPIQYADYAVWQRDLLQGDTLKKQVSYWKAKLAGLTTLQLPTDHPRPVVQTERGASVNVNLPMQVDSAIKSFSQRENVTLFMTLLAAFQALLCRYTGQVDIAVGTPIAGRTRQETEGLIGFFVNTLVLRADLSGNPTFRELLKQVRDTTLDAYTHQDLPFEKLVHELQPERNTGISPLFQVMFILQDPDSFAPKLEGLTVERIGRSIHTAKFDLSLTIRQREGAAQVTLNYNADLFERPTIERMLRHFQIVVQEIVRDPDLRIGDLPLSMREPTDSAHDPLISTDL